MSYSRTAEAERPPTASSSSSAISKSKRYRPYFTPRELDFLSDKQRGKLSYSLEEKTKRDACSLIELIGERLGFPHRTIGTAQTLFHRFHLFYPIKDFAYWDVAHACLYVSTKVHDTLKKPREIIVASYHVRFPEEAEKARAKGGEMEINSKTLEVDRLRLVAVERLVLETICFNFKAQTAHAYVIKLGRALGASKELTKLAYKLAIDSHRTVSPLEHPPHTIALSCLFLAALLTAFPEHGGVSPLVETEWATSSSSSSSYQPSRSHPSTSQPPPPKRTARELGTHLSTPGPWCALYRVRPTDMHEIAHRLLDLLAQQPAGAIHSLSTSPQTPLTPTSPSQNQPSPVPHAALPPSAVAAAGGGGGQTLFTPSHLTRLKIHLRTLESSLPAQPPRPQLSTDDPSLDYQVGPGAVAVLSGAGGGGAAGEVWMDGREAGSVRFFFD